MILPIVQWPDPVLAKVCTPVQDIEGEARQLADDMLETMYAAPGRGLAAPQVGALLRLFVMDTTGTDTERAPRIVINPEILDRSDAQITGPEGCLSIPGVTADVERAEEITLRWTGLDGSVFVERLTGIEAICAQHECDHLDGKITFDRLSAEVRSGLEAEYFA